MEVILEHKPSVCRGCLAIGRRMINTTLFDASFRDLTGIDISPSDGLPQTLCYECSALLRKCVKFRSKVIKSHKLLCQYVHKSISFPHDEKASSFLSWSSIMHYNVPVAQDTQIEEQTIEDSGGPVIIKVESVHVKIESVDSDGEDIIEKQDCVSRRLTTEAEAASRNDRKEGTDEVDTTASQVTESDQVAVKWEQTACRRSDETNRNKLFDNNEILSHCDKIDNRSNVILSHNYVRDINDTINTVDSISNVKLNLCDICGVSFRTKVRLIEHIRVHSGDKPYKCDVCMKCFTIKSNLNKHYRIHTGDKPYKCDVCMKYFTIKSNLINHSRIHTGDKPYKCDLCIKNFSEKSTLTKHYRNKHSSEKPYKCDECTQCFKQKYHLTQHKRIHIGDKPYKCDVCMKCFIEKSTLNKHSRIHNADDKPYKCDL